MTINLLIPPQFVFQDADGKPYAGGKLYTYTPGTLSQKNTWQDPAQSILNTDPVVLDARGACVVYGDGDYRLILTDADNNQIFDLLSSEPLPSSAIGAILPCLGSQTLAQFRDCAGITAAINAALGNINLMPGPVGPTGPQGIQGPTGPTGPAGSDASFSFSMSNPGYIVLGAYGSAPMIQFGFNASDSTGHATVTFARPYAVTNQGVTATVTAPDYWWVNPSSTSNTGFTAVTTSPSVGGTWYGGPIGFFWISIGQ